MIFPMLKQSNEIFTLICHDLTKSGEGICDLDGYKIFVEGALPSEKISCVITTRKKNYAIGKLVEVIKPSENRRKPICPHFDQCGGCQLMHASYDEQLKIKKNRIKNVFSRLAKLDDITIDDVVESLPRVRYRNKIQMPTAWQKGKAKIGLYQKRSHEVIDVEHCYLHNECGQGVYEDVRLILANSSLSYYDEKTRKGELRHLLIRTSSKEGKCLVLLVGTKAPSDELKRVGKEISQLQNVKGVVFGKNEGKSNFVLPQKTLLLGGEDFLIEEIGGVEVRLSVLSFFQVNLVMAERMYNRALELGKIAPGMHVIDAYSGVGVFSTLLAKQGAKVTAIELVKDACDDAKATALQNGLNIDVVCGKVEDVIGGCDRGEVVFLNPPRKGCEEVVLDRVCQMASERIIYTSCDPATLCRDARFLYDQGYRKIHLTPFDLFAQTMHVETIALFTK